MEIALGSVGSVVLIGLVIAGFGAAFWLVVHRELQLKKLYTTASTSKASSCKVTSQMRSSICLTPTSV